MRSLDIISPSRHIIFCTNRINDDDDLVAAAVLNIIIIIIIIFDFFYFVRAEL
jgi:hypothetical protein